MSKKVIVLADNSYTIRRIIELSFSEIENIEVRSFENGSGIREKLLQLTPAVVIVDIKLPELNGYDVCRFINETPSLNRSRVFLMKGSFEPVDNEMIKNLKYEDIITKPFDSNALVSAVMKTIHLEQPGPSAGFAPESPTTFPEEFPEIETEAPESEDISFSDIRGEMEVPPAVSRPAASPPPMERDEIQPSEEITQGTQPLRDNLMPQEMEEPLKNPFDEEPAFDEIGSAKSAARPVPLEFDQESVPDQPAGSGPKDIASEFHDRFLEITNEDTSEDILKTPLETSPLSDTEGIRFPADDQEEASASAAEKLSLDFEKTDMGSPAQTAFAAPDVLDFFPAKKKEPAPRSLELPEQKAVTKEPVVEKSRPEVLSLQDELARLSVKPKKESKIETAVAAVAAEAIADKFALTGKMEDKLNQTIRELLWEIVPPLAEKIIKEEIDKIKSDLNDSGL